MKKIFLILFVLMGLNLFSEETINPDYQGGYIAESIMVFIGAHVMFVVISQDYDPYEKPYEIQEYNMAEIKEKIIALTNVNNDKIIKFKNTVIVLYKSETLEEAERDYADILEINDNWEKSEYNLEK